MRGHQGTLFEVAFSMDGKHVISASRDRLVKIWNTETGAEVRRVHFVKPGFGFEFQEGSGRCQALTRSEFRVSCILQVHTLPGHSDAVSSVALSPDGRRIASGSQDKTVKIWNAETGAEVSKHGGCTL